MSRYLQQEQQGTQEISHSAVVGDKLKTARNSRQPTAGRNNGVENAVKKVQEKARREVEEKDAMWVDNAIEAEAPGGVEAYQVEDIVNG